MKELARYRNSPGKFRECRRSVLWMRRAGLATGVYGDCQHNQEAGRLMGTSAGFQGTWLNVLTSLPNNLGQGS